MVFLSGGDWRRGWEVYGRFEEIIEEMIGTERGMNVEF